MGLVAEALLDLLRRQIEAHGTLVWYDPERAYQDLAMSLVPEQVAGASVVRYTTERGFLWLRRRLEPLWGDRTDPPRLLLYVPMSQAKTENALIEVQVAGAVLRPGQQPPEQNTSLAAVARKALPQLFPLAKVEELVDQVAAGQLSLTDLDRLAEQGLRDQSGVIATVFGTGNAPDVALRFLNETMIDEKIEERNAAANLAALLTEALGVTLSAEKGLPALRVRLARQVLLTDFVMALGKDTPQKLSSFSSPNALRPTIRQFSWPCNGATGWTPLIAIAGSAS